mgnify:CR=1 FL=1
MYNKKSGFTLTELIVVIAILAILSAIGFVSFSNYLTQSRDSARVATINDFEKAFEV